MIVKANSSLPLSDENVLHIHSNFLIHGNTFHYNPVRHQFTQDPFDWPYSSIHDYRQNKDHRISISRAQTLAESNLSFTSTKDFMPDWNDFIEFDY